MTGCIVQAMRSKAEIRILAGPDSKQEQDKIEKPE